MKIDFHTAENADVPHVAVFTVGGDGLQDEILAEFHPLRGETIDKAEMRALAFIKQLEVDDEGIHLRRL